jgi:hypothetical protein
VRTAQCCPLPDIIAQLLLAVKGLFWLLSKLKAPPPLAGVGHRHLRFAMPKKPRKLGSTVVPVKGLSKKYFGKLLKFRESLYKNQFLGYIRSGPERKMSTKIYTAWRFRGTSANIQMFKERMMRKVKCNKCEYVGDETEFPKGHDFFQNKYIASCPKCDNRQSPGDASMRGFGGKRPFVYVDQTESNEFLRRFHEAS